MESFGINNYKSVLYELAAENAVLNYEETSSGK